MKKLCYFFLLLVLFGCNREKVQPQIETNKLVGEIPSHESWNSKVYFSEDGKLKAILYANHLLKYEIKKETLLEKIRIEFYDKQQKNASQLTADKGKVDDITRDMYAFDNVIAQNDSGVVLKTEMLMWRNNDQKIVTDKFVSIKTKKELIEGYGLESDQSLNNYVVFRPTYTATFSEVKK
ncbi:MAG: LPS export ABC transporter periplasmic protein LptC [Melioribacteraceae bacterium]|nr:LPS export ABC transporter periplasmic protein LptC [Melioribacteraceae bacterium]